MNFEKVIYPLIENIKRSNPELISPIILTINIEEKTVNIISNYISHKAKKYTIPFTEAFNDYEPEINASVIEKPSHTFELF